MKVIDLTHVLNADVTLFPGMEKPIFLEVDIEGYAEKKITMYSHTGTHMDAPCHIIKKTKSLDQFPASKFIGKGIVIDCKNIPDNSITTALLKKHEQRIKGTDFVLFNSGWSEKWNTNGYLENFPTLTQDAAKWLTQFNIQGIGLDSISLDVVADMTLPNHFIVLAKEILIIENLTNLDSLPKDGFIFECLPLRIENADGSPIRAIAMVN